MKIFMSPSSDSKLIRLHPDLVGPDHGRSCSTEVLHGGQELVQAVVVVDHVGGQDVVVPVDGGGVGLLQVEAPGQSRHLRSVSAATGGVSAQVVSEVAQELREAHVATSNPLTHPAAPPPLTPDQFLLRSPARLCPPGSAAHGPRDQFDCIRRPLNARL
ncbi:hypothetical protein INR49_016321 [Caranx melampygus]|nr:hypothetical protein INR49_016321 [Caranx melampygus]